MVPRRRHDPVHEARRPRHHRDARRMQRERRRRPRQRRRRRRRRRRRDDDDPERLPEPRGLRQRKPVRVCHGRVHAELPNRWLRRVRARPGVQRVRDVILPRLPRLHGRLCPGRAARLRRRRHMRARLHVPLPRASLHPGVQPGPRMLGPEHAVRWLRHGKLLLLQELRVGLCRGLTLSRARSPARARSGRLEA